MRVWVWGVKSGGEMMKGRGGWRGSFVPSSRLDGLELSMAPTKAAGRERVVGQEDCGGGWHLGAAGSCLVFVSFGSGSAGKSRREQKVQVLVLVFLFFLFFSLSQRLGRIGAGVMISVGFRVTNKSPKFVGSFPLVGA